MLQDLSTEFDSKAKIASSRKLELIAIEDEGKLWANFKKGDESAFTLLYNKYIVPLYNYGERLTPDKALIEDSLHDFFVELWKNRATISQINCVKVYLYKGFKNRLIKNLKKKRKFPFNNISEDYQIEFVFSPEFDLITDQAVKDKKDRVVWMQGEAFFDINHLENNQKFIVKALNIDVEVLGTQFNVNSRRNNTTVVLNSGKVKLNHDDLVNDEFMDPGDLVEFSGHEKKIRKKVVNPEQFSSWKSNILIFKATPLSEIAQTLWKIIMDGISILRTNKLSPISLRVPYQPNQKKR
jgi:DNA-directed RNA polymerase specialized sigma24 family protein